MFNRLTKGLANTSAVITAGGILILSGYRMGVFGEHIIYRQRYQNNDYHRHVVKSIDNGILFDKITIDVIARRTSHPMLSYTTYTMAKVNLIDQYTDLQFQSAEDTIITNANKWIKSWYSN